MIAVAVLLVLVAVVMVPVSVQVTCEHSHQSRLCNQCRGIAIALKSFATDHGGNYPDADHNMNPTTSNQVFRMLFVRGLLDDERDFGGNGSPFVPDGDIGTAPDFKRALEPGENQWATTAGLSDSAGGKMPLVFENTVDGSWPPKWTVDMTGSNLLGRIKPGQKVVVARNDLSVAAELVKPSPEPLRMLNDSENLRTSHPEDFRVLNPEK